ncbi:MAG: NADH-quinone oxidoreductase subunit M [Bacteroidetes bacterium]|nr:NADH-quinone oxidoreductase subunit M [Bacteroidota bacterium]
MNNTLLIVLLWPLVSMVLSLLPAKEAAGKTAFALSLAGLLLSVYLFLGFVPANGMQQVMSYAWIPALGISFKIGMDGISLLLIMLTNVLTPLIILSSFGRKIENPKAFYALILLMQFAMLGVFVALDGFLFYIFWELALIPIYFICLLWGGKDRVRITLKFFIYTLTGSLLMLVSLIYLYLQTPDTHTFDIDAFYQLKLSGSQQAFVLWTMFIAFAVKIPIFPLHSWQPDTYVDAPTPGTMLLSGIMLKMGIYGLLRWLLPTVPAAVHEYGFLIMAFCVAGVVYASCIAIVQKDFKRLVAYASIAHVGLISAGVFTLNSEATEGAVFQMLSHGVNAVGLFFIADILMTRLKTRNLAELGGIVNNQKLFAIAFMIIMLGTVALPLTNGFVGEFLLLTGIYAYHKWMAFFAGLSVILGVVYMFRSYQAIMLGSRHLSDSDFSPLTISEKTVLVSVAALVVLMGIFPSVLLDTASPSVKALLSLINAQ